MILTALKELVRERTDQVLKSKGKEISLPSFDVSVPPPKVPGDLAANVVLMIAKEAGQPPRELAEEILKGFPANGFTNRIEIAGPGFLNFWLKDEALRWELEELLALPEPPPARRKKVKDKVLIEFVSANPTGPLHVGHGRGAALGDSLVRIFRKLKVPVKAEFYVNDAGGQIRNLGLSVEARVHELKGEPFTFPEDGYKGRYVKDLAEAIVAEKKSLKSVAADQMIFSTHDYAGFASEKNLEGIRETLKSFGVSFDHWLHESSLHNKGEVLRMIEELKKKDLAFEKDGAVWFRATQFGDDKDRVLQKASEAPTYFASDLAYHADKFARGYETLINIWGADHHGYAQRLKGALEAIGFESSRLRIIFNQLVSLKGGRLSKREGDIVTLKELIQEVGKDAARFFFALRSPGTHFEFDLDLAKKQAPDNPVYYVQYVHARCCSIFKEAEKRELDLDLLAWKKHGMKQPLSEAEKDVILHLASFDRTVEICARDFSSHHLTSYLLELAGKFHGFYEKCMVLVDEPVVRSFRLGLVHAIRRRVAEGLDLLGVGAPEKL